MWQWRPFEELIDVDTIIADIDDYQCALDKDEFALVATAVPARVREFTAGRSLARSMLSHRDIRPKCIIAGDRGQPLWPDGICGSISHTASRVGVAVSSLAAYRGIGLDIETEGAARHLDETLILSAGERERTRADAGGDHATLAFCCKEAVFKSVFPIVGEALDFADITIEADGDGFCATTAGTRRSSDAVASGRGVIAKHDGLLAALFTIGNERL